MAKFVRLFQQSFRSLYLVKNKNKDGEVNDKITRLLKENRTIILPIDPSVNTTRDVTDRVKILFGKNFYFRSVFRYFFPRRFIYVPTLFPKSKTIYRSDENIMKKIVRAELPKFKGIAKNRFLDLRNIVLDYSSLYSSAIIKDPRFLKRPSVMAYVKDVIPEIISYILFDSVNKDSIQELPEIDDEATEELKVRYFNNMKPEVDTSILSEEDFNLKLLSKTKTFASGGDPGGAEKYGYNNFVIVWKFNSTYDRIAKREVINGKLATRIAELKDPNIIYDLAFIQFIYKLYECYYNNEKSDNEFINEFLKRRVIFYIYVDKGLGFSFDCEELKSIMRWTPRRVLSRLNQLINLFIKCNRMTVTDQDIEDAMKEDDEEKEELEISPDQVEDVDKKKLNLDIKNILNQYKSFSLFNKLLKKKANEESSVIDTLRKANAAVPATRPSMNPEKEPTINIARVINQYNLSLREDDEISPEADDDSYTDDNSEDVIENSDSEIDSIDPDNTTIEVEEDETKEEGDAIDSSFISSEIKLDKKQEKIVASAQEKFKDIKVYDNVSVKDIMEHSVDEISGEYNKFKKTIKTRDKSLQKSSTVRDFTKTYIKNKLDYDIINAVKALEYNGVGTHFYITDIKVSDTSTQLDRKKTYRFSLTDTSGKKHELVFDVPIPDDNGFLYMNGNKFLFKKQNFPLPIVKIAPDTVMYTTHHPYKVFISRHGTGFNKSSILLKRILTDYLMDNEKSIKVVRGSVKTGNDDYLTNFEYDDLADVIYNVEIKNSKRHIKIFFNQSEIRKEIESLGIDDSKFVFSYESIETRKNATALPYAIDYNTRKVYAVDISKDSSISDSIIKIITDNVSDIEKLKNYVSKFNLPKQRMYSELGVMRRSCPLIIFLASLYGLERVMKTAKIEYTFTKERVKEKDLIGIKLADGILYYKQHPVENSLLMNGLAYMKPENYTFKDLNTPEPYGEYYLKKFGSKSVYRDWFSMEQFFLDPVTIKVLSMQGIPHTFLESYIYANMLLNSNDYIKESSVKCYRLRNFEIFAEQLYQELIKSRIEFQRKRGKRNSLSVPRDFLMKRLKKTTLLQNFDDASPIMEAKGCSIVSLKGPGGTNLSEAFKIDKRSFGEDNAGIYAFANTDSGTVGTLRQLSMNPSIRTTLGFYDPIDKTDSEKLKFSNLVSPEESLVPFTTQVDDPKRIIFLSSQSAHIIPTDNDLPIIRTGSEKTFHELIGDTYCFKAKKDGVVTEVDEVNSKIFITYNDGSKDVVDYKPKLNKISNFFLENTLVPVVKTGQKLVEQQPIAANDKFFKVENGKMLFAQGKLARIAIFESYGNDEDGCMMTQTMSEKMSTAINKKKQVIMKAKSSNIFSMKKIGDHVNTSDYLISFDESGAANALGNILSGLDEDTMASLRNSPKAGYTGKIVDIRMYWTIPPEQMSASCRSVVEDYIKRVKKDYMLDEKFTGIKSFDRHKIDVTVPHNEMINGAKVDKEGSLLIEFFIQHNSFMAAGDKVTFHSSVKSTVTSVIPSEVEPYTENGQPIDFIISGLAIFRRMVNSIWITGFMGKVFDDFSRNVATEFLEKIKK